MTHTASDDSKDSMQPNPDLWMSYYTKDMIHKAAEQQAKKQVEMEKARMEWERATKIGGATKELDPITTSVTAPTPAGIVPSYAPGEYSMHIEDKLLGIPFASIVELKYQLDRLDMPIEELLVSMEKIQ